MRRDLTPEQAAILRAIWQAKKAADDRWKEATTLVGIDPSKIVGGELGEDPHLMVRED